MGTRIACAAMYRRSSAFSRCHPARRRNTNSDAADINDCGQVVGASARTPDGAEHAALWFTASE